MAAALSVKHRDARSMEIGCVASSQGPAVGMLPSLAMIQHLKSGRPLFMPPAVALRMAWSLIKAALQTWWVRWRIKREAQA